MGKKNSEFLPKIFVFVNRVGYYIERPVSKSLFHNDKDRRDLMTKTDRRYDKVEIRHPKELEKSLSRLTWWTVA